MRSDLNSERFKPTASTEICSNILAAPYIKVYLMDGKSCVEKQKTVTARRTLDPLYQQQLCFSERYSGKILQVFDFTVQNKWILFNQEQE